MEGVERTFSKLHQMHHQSVLSPPHAVAASPAPPRAVLSRCRRLNLPCLPQIKKRQGGRSSDPAPWAQAAPPPPIPPLPDGPYNQTAASTQMSLFMSQRVSLNAMDVDAASRLWAGVASAQSRGGAGGAGYGGGGSGGEQPWSADVLQAASIVQALADRNGRQQTSLSADRGGRSGQAGAGGGAPLGDQDHAR